MLSKRDFSSLVAQSIASIEDAYAEALERIEELEDELEEMGQQLSERD